MRRILVIGNSGAGKSTVARALGDRLGLPVIHLDTLFYGPGWTAVDAVQFRTRAADAVTGPGWVCDGNFSDSFVDRMPLADTIVWVDRPAWLCLYRAFRRAITDRRRERADLPPGCDETIDLGLYRDILRFARDYVPRIETALATHGGHARLHRLRSDRDVAALMDSLTFERGSTI